MTNPNMPDEEEKPLDPTMEKLRRKMVRLLFISSSVIVLALMTVLGSIVYKSQKNSGPVTAQTPAAGPSPAVTVAKQAILLPKGFVLESTTVDGNRIWFMGSAEGKHIILVHDIGTAKTLTEIDIAIQP